MWQFLAENTCETALPPPNRDLVYFTDVNKMIVMMENLLGVHEGESRE